LRHRIERWQEVQKLYMPAAIQQGPLPTNSYDHPESIPLQLPSSLSMSSQLMLPGDLVEKEKHMRIAQAYDSLSELRRLLRISMGLSHYKYTQVGYGQRANTRARSLMQRYQAKIVRCADRYRDARSALLRLGSDALLQFQVLEDCDIRRPGCDQDDDGRDKGEGVRELSWIWLVQKDSSENSTEVNENEVNDSEFLVYFAI
jgi:hypothetical protein